MKNNADDFMNEISKNVITEVQKRDFEASIPYLVESLKKIYDEMKEKGFNDMVSYDFAKSVMLGNN